jgi:hypothetical protein
LKEAALAGDKYGTLAISAGYMFTQAMKWREEWLVKEKKRVLGWIYSVQESWKRTGPTAATVEIAFLCCFDIQKPGTAAELAHIHETEITKCLDGHHVFFFIIVPAF